MYAVERKLAKKISKEKLWKDEAPAVDDISIRKVESRSRLLEATWRKHESRV